MSVVRSEYSTGTVSATNPATEITLPSPTRPDQLYWLSFFDAVGDTYLTDNAANAAEGLKVKSGSPQIYGPFRLATPSYKYLFASAPTDVEVTVLLGE